MKYVFPMLMMFAISPLAMAGEMLGQDASLKMASGCCCGAECDCTDCDCSECVPGDCRCSGECCESGECCDKAVASVAPVAGELTGSEAANCGCCATGDCECGSCKCEACVPGDCAAECCDTAKCCDGGQCGTSAE